MLAPFHHKRQPFSFIKHELCAERTLKKKKIESNWITYYYTLYMDIGILHKVFSGVGERPLASNMYIHRSVCGLCNC